MNKKNCTYVFSAVVTFSSYDEYCISKIVSKSTCVCLKNEENCLNVILLYLLYKLCISNLIRKIISWQKLHTPLKEKHYNILQLDSVEKAIYQ
jgi:hypothetical protein